MSMSELKVYKCDWCAIVREYMAEPEEGKQWRTVHGDVKITTWGYGNETIGHMNMFGKMKKGHYCSDRCLLNACLVPDDNELEGLRSSTQAHLEKDNLG